MNGSVLMETEKRLIDANEADPRNLAFPIHADGGEYSPYERGYNDAVISCYGLLMNVPTVDAVEVVRCKDCCYYTEKKKRCDHPCLDWDVECYDHWLEMEPNDFCSYGERRSDG